VLHCGAGSSRADTPGCAYPRLREGARRGPRRRPWGYDEFLEAVTDPKHKRHNELLEWRGDDFDPQQFDIGQINRRLALVATAARPQSGPPAELTSGAYRAVPETCRKGTASSGTLPAHKHLDRKVNPPVRLISTAVADKRENV
jgi:Plasmid pRiA4b ORF-3-like protein